MKELEDNELKSLNGGVIGIDDVLFAIAFALVWDISGNPEQAGEALTAGSARALAR